MFRPPGLSTNEATVRWLTPPAEMFRPPGYFFSQGCSFTPTRTGHPSRSELLIEFVALVLGDDER
jgi:hypothetical protein